MPPRARTITLLFITIGVPMALGFLLVRAFQPPLPISKFNSLKPGMTQAEVRTILGEPTQTLPGGHEYEVRGTHYVTDDQWTYRRLLTFGYVNIHFDANRLFTDYNCEEF